VKESSRDVSFQAKVIDIHDHSSYKTPMMKMILQDEDSGFEMIANIFSEHMPHFKSQVEKDKSYLFKMGPKSNIKPTETKYYDHQTKS
jgi:hypothetical protein